MCRLSINSGSREGLSRPEAGKLNHSSIHSIGFYLKCLCSPVKDCLEPNVSIHFSQQPIIVSYPEPALSSARSYIIIIIIILLL
jgi:hypothetical protein